MLTMKGDQDSEDPEVRKDRQIYVDPDLIGSFGRNISNTKVYINISNIGMFEVEDSLDTILKRIDDLNNS